MFKTKEKEEVMNTLNYTKHLSRIFKPQFLKLSHIFRFIIKIPHNTFISEFGLISKTIIVYLVIVGGYVLIN